MNYPTCMPIEKEIKAFVNGEELQILKTNAAYFIPVQYENIAKVKFITYGKYSEISISPKRLDIHAKKTADGFEFELSANLNLCIFFEGLALPVFFYGNKPEKYDGNATYFFKAGAVYEAGEIVLSDNESVYIEAGAVVRGRITAEGASNIKVYGQGILDGSYYTFRGESKKSICFKKCNNIEIKDIIMIEPTVWMIAMYGCLNVHIDGIKQIGEVVSSDGIDIVGCADVLVENCILMNNDDCVVIKHMSEDGSDEGLKYLLPTSNICVKNCVLFNSYAGNALEIGHELRCDTVSDIVFSDIDIIRVDRHGAPFSIHAGDRAVVRDILFENIYVEHYYDKLFDFRVMKSRFNKDKEYGSIRDITLRNIYITNSEYNAGYSVSTIGGHDENHKVSNMLFENVCINGEKLLSPNQIDLYTKDTENIVFR